MPKSSDIPDDAISQAAVNKWGVYYRIHGSNITVVFFKSPKTGNEIAMCLTCNKNDSCHHTRAVRRYCNHPIEQDAA